MDQTMGTSACSSNRRAGAKPGYLVSFPKSRACRELDGEAGSQKGMSAGQSLNSRSNAKAALLAAMEVHSSLTQLENECNKSYKDNQLSMPDWKISSKAASAEEEECSEFTSMPSRSSSGMTEAISIKPNSSDLELDFDGHDFGFFGDIGVKVNALAGEPAMNAISEENIMPWDV